MTFMTFHSVGKIFIPTDFHIFRTEYMYAIYIYYTYSPAVTYIYRRNLDIYTWYL